MRHAIGLALMTACAFAQSGTVEGRVTNPATGAGIEGVTMSLLTRTDGATTTTDTSGSYRFLRMAAGSYGLSGVKEGYYGTPEWNAFAPSVQVTDGTTVRVDQMLLPFLTLRGRVIDLDGNPIAKVNVGLLPPRANEAITDKDGRFEFAKLRPGAYRLVATPTEPDFVRTFYPSIIERWQAATIVLRSGVEAGEFEIQLQKSPVHRVTGVVLDESGKPAASSTVKLVGVAGQGLEIPRFGGNAAMWSVSLRPEARAVEAKTTTDGRGRFEFAAVAPGSWRVEAISAPLEEIESRNVVSGGGMEIAVARSDVEDLEIQLGPPFGIEVSSEWGDREPPRKPAVPFELWPLDGQPGPAGFAMDPPRYREIVPGLYRIVEGFYHAPPGFYLAAVMMGSQDVLGQEIGLSANTPPLRAIFRRGTTTVHVKVEHGDGSAVILIPTSSPQEANRNAEIRMQAVKGGSIDLVEVAPGDYAIVAFDRIDRDMLGVQMVLNSIVGNAASLKVEAGANPSVELQVSHWAW